jgi:hypothetical protein
MVLGSGIRIPDLGVKKAPDPGSGSATLVVYRSGSINICSDPDLRIRNSELRITLVIGETNYKRTARIESSSCIDIFVDI